MKTACQKLATSRWEYISKVGGWFKAKRVRVRAYFAEKNPVCTPFDRWWIYIMIAEAFAARATVTFKQLQVHSVTVSMQREHLKSLMLFYMECVSAKGPFLADGGEADTLDSNVWHVLTSKTFAGSLVEAKSFIDDQGSFVSEILASTDDGEVRDVVKSVATLFINAINGIDEIVAERDPNNRGANSEDSKLPPVAPQDLVLIHNSEFSAIVRSQKECLLTRWTLGEIDLIEQEPASC